jgi:hypothetical protein
VCHGRPAGEFGRGIDGAAAIGDRKRLAAVRAEGREILDRQRAASGLHVGRHAAREIARIKIAGAFLRQVRQRRLEAILIQPHVGLDAPLRLWRQAVL